MLLLVIMVVIDSYLLIVYNGGKKVSREVLDIVLRLCRRYTQGYFERVNDDDAGEIDSSAKQLQKRIFESWR